MNKIALVEMPWGRIDCASYYAGLTRSLFERENICAETFYFNLLFAKHIGVDIYNEIGNNIYHPVKDWIFGQVLFGKQGTGELSAGYNDFMNFLLSKMEYNEAGVSLRRYRSKLRSIIERDIPDFIMGCINDIHWNDYSMVYFFPITGNFVASLLFAKKLKEKYPHISTVFAGINVEGSIGAQIHHDFNWIDYVITDCEHEKNITQLAVNLANGCCINEMQGIISRDNEGYQQNRIIIPKETLDDLPIPDYSEYYGQLKLYGLSDKIIETTVLFECSRGCWWGEKVHCSFCGVNGSAIKYRCKSPEVVLNEILFLKQKYGAKNFHALDFNMNMSYLTTLIPELIKRKLDINLFFELKSNLNYSQLTTVRNAGMKVLLVGIESLNTHLLNLMGKGVTAIQNIQFLKWCNELGLEVIWFMLYRIPREDLNDYEKMIDIIPSISHLQPPASIRKIDIYRHSPYFDEPDKYGIYDIQPNNIFKYIYSDRVCLQNIATFFDFNFVGCSTEKYVNQLTSSVYDWMKSYKSKEVFCQYTLSGDSLIISDNRKLNSWEDTKGICEYVYSGIQKEIYLFCKAAHSFDSICKYLESNVSWEIDRDTIKDIIKEFVSNKLMFTEDDKYLSLATCQEVD